MNLEQLRFDIPSLLFPDDSITEKHPIHRLDKYQGISSDWMTKILSDAP
jgi:hypothetical protein